MEPKYTTFEQAKLLKEKGFNEECNMFYTKPNSKMFGVDEHGRYYPIKSKPKELWIVGNVVTLNLKNVILAPEQHQVVEWLIVNHGIWVYSYTNGKIWYACIQHTFGDMVELPSRLGEHNSPQEAYSAAFDYILNNNLI
jgi:hypothetical protein